MAGNGSEPLGKPSSTGGTTVVRIRPFTVTLVCPELWDPSDKKLPVTYTISDPNARIKRGRLIYSVPGDEGEIVVHGDDLPLSLLKHGVDLKLPDANAWDGVISEGMAKRKGKKVTADLSPVSVELMVWNTDVDKPAKSLPRGKGRTEREGEWMDNALDLTNIDAIVKGEWDRNWAVPMPPEGRDEGKDKVTITLKVKNVIEGETAVLEIYRIGDIGDTLDDELYTDSDDTEDQPGLVDLVVKDGKVVQKKDGAAPEMVFNKYDIHYDKPGVNFYCFAVRFGENGDTLIASERDYENNEKKCLQLRFSVLVHGPAGDLSYARSAVNYLYSLFSGKTKYWRPIKLKRGPKDARDWFSHHGGRAMVIFSGHSSCYCEYPGVVAKDAQAPVEDSEPAKTYNGHPKYYVKKGKKKGWHYKRSPDSKFGPDLNKCPIEISKKTVGGCGQKPWVTHEIILGRSPNLKSLGSQRRKKRTWSNRAGRMERDALELWVEGDDSASGLFTVKTVKLPKFAYFADGCRTMLTTNLGEHYVQNGTKYFAGWEYSVFDDVSAGMIKAIFRGWLGGTKKNPAPDEYDLDRFKAVVMEEMARYKSRRRYQPRLMVKGGVINPGGRPPASAVADAVD